MNDEIDNVNKLQPWVAPTLRRAAEMLMAQGREAERKTGDPYAGLMFADDAEFLRKLASAFEAGAIVPAQRLRDAELRALSRAERRRQEIDDEAYEYAEKAGEWQARAERMERERDEALVSRQRVPDEIRRLPDEWRSLVGLPLPYGPATALVDCAKHLERAIAESGDDHE